MTAEAIPSYSVSELNSSIGNLVERGFAPRFLVRASVSKPQIKKGHLWLSLSDGDATISAVVWSSKLKNLSYKPKEGEGVIVIGKLNFWTARATLNVQVLDIRPSISTILRQFEIVRDQLTTEGLIDIARHRALPKFPESIAILTSKPSSALADILKTAKERWPLTRLLILPIPVQGNVAKEIQSTVQKLASCHKVLNLQAVVIARGGGSREDLMVFDDEDLCREVANFPIPVITGLGHEDDLTVLDLVSDHRAATPTAAIVALLPNKREVHLQLLNCRDKLDGQCNWLIRQKKQYLSQRHSELESCSPPKLFSQKKANLSQRAQLLEALSPELWLSRGFAVVKSTLGKTIHSLEGISVQDKLTIHFSDGEIVATAEEIHPKPNPRQTK